MTHGSKLHCVGIVGDGCGGGREFFIEHETLYVYDPVTKTTTKLADAIAKPLEISKKGCKIFITTQTGVLTFDLSLLRFI